MTEQEDELIKDKRILNYIILTISDRCFRGTIFEGIVFQKMTTCMAGIPLNLTGW